MSERERYSVHNSTVVGESFRRHSEVARAAGQLPLFIIAAKWIMEERARTPAEFGESREYFPHAGLSTRCGFARPLYVEFAIDEREKVVYVRRFELIE